MERLVVQRATMVLGDEDRPGHFVIGPGDCQRRLRRAAPVKIPGDRTIVRTDKEIVHVSRRVSAARFWISDHNFSDFALGFARVIRGYALVFNGHALVPNYVEG